MVSAPGVTPVTIPPAKVADALLMFQIPPEEVSVKVFVAPTHAKGDPIIVPAFGNGGLIVITFTAVAAPHTFVTVYMMISMPIVTPVTTPPDMVAVLPLLLHTPPGVISVKVMLEPTHTLEGPVMVPAVMGGLIVRIFVAIAVPHELVTS